MTDRAREISAFITPFELFEWSRMPFGLKMPRRFINASRRRNYNGRVPDRDRGSVLGRRSYIDDIMSAAES
ncbi:reverse transcriptase [Phytophthora megakarya]|uniref:Reverse transcriptase n=1 Tax=Phytophthora megakarya TaxID=4795 RepID=A0A225WHD7_9STRA|nr:reverse transcriptase [Phytophthora megakarya]